MNVILRKTDAGNGLKILVNGEWLYTSIVAVEQVLSGDAKHCEFSRFRDRD